MTIPLDRVSLAVDFTLDTENRLATLAGLADSNAFQAAVSLAPGAAAVAKSVSALSKLIMNTFLGDADPKDVLRFEADLNLPSGDLEDAYYVILGSRYEEDPLPRPLPGRGDLEVRESGDLLYKGEPVTRWSYVILDVDVIPARGRHLGRGEGWSAKLDQALAEARAIDRSPFANQRERDSAWKKCESLLREAELLLNQSPLYLPEEMDDIIRTTYLEAWGKVFPQEGGLRAPPALSPATQSFLKVGSPAELEARCASYAGEERSSEARLRQMGVLQQ